MQLQNLTAKTRQILNKVMFKGSIHSDSYILYLIIYKHIYLKK